ncbi:DHA2 family efflux MFS transporter permease subunit [Gorillibacterium massiliense]|uniref:DHA2 family efflux MFS transporter permease subunit n=1 Tax=Gorillibacterium massiliense TaxID=1280390 RepID=UPI0004B1996E|nr:DHA2 family efflux MFS transporter permease subunit [Gorillibacterium massiliense]
MSSTKTPPKQSYGFLVILMVGAFFTVLCSTLMSNVTPIIMSKFGISASTAQWMTTVYMLTAGILVPTSAFLLSKYSTRRLFLLCMGVFTIGTLLGGLAPNFAILIIARVIQALGASLVMPLLMNILFSTFPPDKRGKAMGLFGFILIFAPAIGPTIAGLVLEVASWRALFHLIWPITLIVFLFAYFKLESNKETQPGRIDILSVLLSALAFGGIIYAFSSAGKRGWDDAVVIVSLIVGILGLVTLILRQNKLAEPMLSFKIFLNPKFTVSIITFCIILFAMYSVMIPMPIYLQSVRGISALKTGLLMMPGSVLMGLLMPVNGTLYDKFGVKPLVWVGFPLILIASVMLSQMSLSTTFFYICLAYALRMVGVGIVQIPMQTNSMNSLDEKEFAHGTAMTNTLQQVVGAISSSLIITTITTRATAHGKDLMKEALQNGTALTQQLKETISHQAMIAGTNDAYLISIAVVVVGFIFGLFVKTKKSQKGAHHHGV